MEQLDTYEIRRLEHRPIIGHRKYAVKKNGQVWNIESDSPVKHTKTIKGWRIYIPVFGGNKHYHIALVVISAWKGIPITQVQKKLITYIDGNVFNIDPTNLKYDGWDKQ